MRESRSHHSSSYSSLSIELKHSFQYNDIYKDASIEWQILYSWDIIKLYCNILTSSASLFVPSRQAGDLNTPSRLLCYHRRRIQQDTASRQANREMQHLKNKLVLGHESSIVSNLSASIFSQQLHQLTIGSRNCDLKYHLYHSRKNGT